VTRREVFEKVKKHLLKQGQPALNRDGECVYRSDEGLMCAVGCLIPKRLYKASLENQSIICPAVLEALKKAGVPTNATMVSMLVSLQTLHDGVEFEGWAEGLDRIELEFFS